jgi:hypothetical protein
MEEEINRLGFDAWADNKFVNAIENYETFIGTGEVKFEDEEVCAKFFFSENAISCVIRAYTHEGWKTYEKEIKR